MELMTCIGKDNRSRTFRCHYEKNPLKERWVFFVYTALDLPSGEFYEASFETDTIDTTIARSVGMHGYAPEYREVGLPEAIILKARTVIGKRIVSSRNRGEKPPDERRSLQATKAWERLVNRGIASYDEGSDTFTLLDAE